MKNPSFLPLLFIFISACNFRSPDNTREAVDSIQYSVLPPGQLDEKEKQEYSDKLTHFFDSMLLRSVFNGGILIAKNGVVLYEKYRGLVDLRKKDSINEHTPIHLASSSKPFMGVAILRLVQEGKLSLDDSLSNFFPELPFKGITVAMLLSHRSGLPNYLYFMDKSDWDKKVFATNEDVYHILCRDKPKGGSAPDKHFSYSNTNFVLLAMLLEKITGQSYPEYMKQKFFEPLQMNDTYVFTLKDTLSSTPSFTTGGRYWEFDYLDGTYGDKNIYSTPRDLLKWDQALYSGQVVRNSLLDSAFIPRSHERPSIHNYGLGWRLENLPNGKRVVYHFGKWHGFNAAFARLMDEKVTIIILGNRFTRMIYNTAHRSYELFGPYGQKQEEEPDDNEREAARQSSKK